MRHTDKRRNLNRQVGASPIFVLTVISQLFALGSHETIKHQNRLTQGGEWVDYATATTWLSYGKRAYVDVDKVVLWSCQVDDAENHGQDDECQSLCAAGWLNVDSLKVDSVQRQQLFASSYRQRCEEGPIAQQATKKKQLVDGGYDALPRTDW